MINILLVDDSRSVREVVKFALEAVDYELRVHTVAGAASCIHVLRTGKPFVPDVVLLDLRLASDDRPGGLALLPLIAVPVVLFTGIDDVSPAVVARCAGYVLKGTPADQIARTIRALFSETRTPR